MALQDKLALPLLIMLGQQRRYIATSTASPHLKLIAELYDKCQETLYLVRNAISLKLCVKCWALLRPFALFKLKHELFLCIIFFVMFFGCCCHRRGV